jgi:hypothetical protein
LGVKIKQYMLFVVYSDALEPEQISRRVGIDADAVVLRASRIADPPRPVTNIWQLRSEGSGLTVDDHIQRLTERLRPVRNTLIALLDEQSDVTMRFEVVRYFNAEEGEDEVINLADGLEKLAGQHQLLGWTLTRDAMDFFRDLRAELWFDEYG